jgi:hypothetical protein
VAAQHAERWLRSPVLGDRTALLVASVARAVAEARTVRAAARSALASAAVTSSSIEGLSAPAAAAAELAVLDEDERFDSKAVDALLKMRLKPAQVVLTVVVLLVRAGESCGVDIRTDIRTGG